MNSNLKEITTSALRLTKEDRIDLAKSILESIDEQTILYQKEWMDVVKEREENYKAGKSTSTSWDEIKSELKQNNKTL